VIMRRGKIRLETQGCMEVLDSQLVSTCLTGDQPEKMQGINLVRIHLQDLQVELLGLLPLACLELSPGHIQRLRNRDHGSSPWSAACRRHQHRHTPRSSCKKSQANRLPSHNGEDAMRSRSPSRRAARCGKSSARDTAKATYSSRSRAMVCVSPTLDK